MSSKTLPGTQASSPQQTLVPVKALLIEAYDGDKLLASATLENQSLIVGRIMSADFKIPDPRVSRFHALVERVDEGQIKLTDLGSSQGTFVNGQKIIEKILAPSDDIKVSTISLKIKWTTIIPEALREALSGEARTLTPAPISESFANKDEEMTRVEPVVQRKPEMTQVSALKEIARTRGVLDTVGKGIELEVTVYWENTILAVDHLGASTKEVFVGSDQRSQYVVPDGENIPYFKFLELGSGEAELFLHPAFQGSLRLGGVMYRLQDLKEQGKTSVKLKGADLAKIQIGQVNFFLMFVPEPPKIVMAPVLEREPFFWFITASTFALVAMILILAYLNQDPVEGKVVEFPEKLRKILIQQYQAEIPNKVVNETPPETLPEPDLKPKPTAKKGDIAQKAETVPDAQIVAKKAQAGGNEGEGAREKGAEGKRGKPDAAQKTGLTSRPKVANATKTFDGDTKTKTPDKKPSPKAMVAPPDLLQSLKNSGIGNRIAKVAGTGNTSSEGNGGGAQGNDPLDEALSGVGGGGIRSGQGSGGSGLQGTGGGGGGSAVGVGGLGTQGFGGGAKGTGKGSLPGKGELLVGTETQEVTVLGSLTREQIERVVNSRMNEVRFCYQRELGRDPRLAGKILLAWTIVQGGQVQSVKVKENTTGSSSLSQCLRDRLERWQFPSPTGGSEATVEWPWNFKPSGT